MLSFRPFTAAISVQTLMALPKNEKKKGKLDDRWQNATVSSASKDDLRLLFHRDGCVLSVVPYYVWDSPTWVILVKILHNDRAKIFAQKRELGPIIYAHSFISILAGKNFSRVMVLLGVKGDAAFLLVVIN